MFSLSSSAEVVRRREWGLDWDWSSFPVAFEDPSCALSPGAAGRMQHSSSADISGGYLVQLLTFRGAEMPSEHHSLAEQVPSTAVPLEAKKTNNSRRDLTALAHSHLFRRGCEKEKIRRLWQVCCSDKVINMIWGHWWCKDAGFGFKGGLDTKQTQIRE